MWNLFQSLGENNGLLIFNPIINRIGYDIFLFLQTLWSIDPDNGILISDPMIYRIIYCFEPFLVFRNIPANHYENHHYILQINFTRFIILSSKFSSSLRLLPLIWVWKYVFSCKNTCYKPGSKANSSIRGIHYSSQSKKIFGEGLYHAIHCAGGSTSAY